MENSRHKLTGWEAVLRFAPWSTLRWSRLGLGGSFLSSGEDLETIKATSGKAYLSALRHLHWAKKEREVEKLLTKVAEVPSR